MIDKTLEEEIHAISKAEQPIQKYWAQLTGIIIFAFGLGGAYVKIDALADELKSTQGQAQTNTISAQSLAQKLVRIEGNQDRFKNDIEELKEQNEKLDEKLDKILEEIRKQ